MTIYYKMSKLLLIFFVALCIHRCSSSKSELLTVVSICRHGIRAPLGTYKNDPFSTRDWGVPYGHLTNEGMVQQHHLGKWFRKRYSNLLPKLYHSKHFKAVSSDIGRCISSAAVCAAGIYPPDDVEMWHPTLRWQPVPIYVSRDALLYQWIFCPKHRRLWTALKKSEVYQKILRENEGFLKFLTEKSGVDLNSLSAVRLLFGIFYDQRGFNVTFPDWIQSSYRKLQDLSRQLMISYTYTPELARLRSGPLLGKIIKHFDNVISNSTELKFVLYSAHECTLINTLNSMGIYDYHVPEYSATLLFELRRDDIGVFVNILYKNSTKLYQLGLKECVFRCDLEQFRGELHHLVVMDMDQWNVECKSQ